MSHKNHPFMTCQIVGRCHISESNRTVLRYYISRLRDKEITWRGLPRSFRKERFRGIIECHALNQDLYNFVVRGHSTA